MRKRNPFFMWMAILCLLAIGLVNLFAPDGWLKNTVSVIGVITLVYELANEFFKNHLMVRRFNWYLRTHYFWGNFVGSVAADDNVADSPYFTFKGEMLRFTISQLQPRMRELSNPDVFSFDFDIKPLFEAGTRPENTIESWRGNMDKKFSFLVGLSGSGKTFEMVRRATYACEKILAAPGRDTQLKGKKIPVYIELKSLDLPLDERWIIEYMIKTAATKNKIFSEGEVRRLIVDREVIFFFDGLDEVHVQWRKSTLEKILEFANRTGVVVSCRTKVFSELLERNAFPTDLKPAVYHFEPLEIRKIHQLIDRATSLTDEDRRRINDFLRGHQSLYKHLSRSIMLNLFLIVFEHLSEAEKNLLIASDEVEFNRLIWQYYEDQIAWKKLPRDADTLGFRTWSVMIAKIMRGQSFSIESVQPASWLIRVKANHNIEANRLLQGLYFLFTRIIAASFVGFAIAFLVATPFAFVSTAILGGVIISIIAGIYKRIEPRSNSGKLLINILLPMGMFFFLVLFCGLYQGLCVPRSDSESAGRYFSPTEAWPGILLGFALSTIFITRIITEKKNDIYIQTREKYHFSPRYALIYGLGWGCVSGLITGCIALGVKHQFSSGRFIKHWLIPFLTKLIGNSADGKITEFQLDIAIFLYAFIVTFFVASIIIVLMAARYNEPKMDENNKQALNYGIYSSLKHSVVHGVVVFFLACLLYYAAMFRVTEVSWYFCLKVSSGLAILAFLWYGGMEVINHGLLRVSLAIHGIAPLRFRKWFEANKHMGLIVPTGYKMRFYHPSLEQYYSALPMLGNPRLRIWTKVWTDVIYFSIALAFCTFLFFKPLIIRYYYNPYNHGPHEVNVTMKGLKAVDNACYKVERTGSYHLDASGKINVGTFVGDVTPEGTLYGFMGMPIGSAYNFPGLGHFPHAALLYHIKRDSQWMPYQSVSLQHQPLKLNSGDLIQFLVNDIEPENNKDTFEVKIEPQQI